MSSHYTERLSMSWPWWLIAGLFAVSIAIAVAAWTPPVVGLVATVIILAVTLWAGLAAGATRIRADDQAVTVGGSRIEWRWIDRVRACDTQTMATVTHSRHQIDAFIVTRPWISTGVVLRLADPADPHPAWILSTRHPQELAAVVQDHLHQADRPAVAHPGPTGSTLKETP